MANWVCLNNRRRAKGDHLFRVKMIVTKKCQECGRSYKISSQFAYSSKFCSTDCRNARNRREQVHKKSVKATVTCQNCDKPFQVRRGMAKVQKYCSRSCAMSDIHGSQHTGQNNHKWKPKVKVICLYCGKEFETYPSRQGRKHYCCKAHHLLGNISNLMGNHRTDIEVAMAGALKQAGIVFQEQAVMFDKFQVDFLLPNRVIVQCDGVYWHDRPEARRRDKGQDAYFKKCGYTVLRFTDKQIKNDIHGCISRIKNVV